MSQYKFSLPLLWDSFGLVLRKNSAINSDTTVCLVSKVHRITVAR